MEIYMIFQLFHQPVPTMVVDRPMLGPVQRRIDTPVNVMSIPDFRRKNDFRGVNYLRSSLRGRRQ